MTSQLAVLNEIARIASEDLELRPMLQRITDSLSARFAWPFVACVSVDAGRGVFVCEAVTSRFRSEVTVGYSRALGSGVVGEVALTGAPILVNDARQHPNFVQTMPGAQAELCVPVKHRGELVAVLNLESLETGAFRDELPLLQTVAEQVAGAIASARLYEELKRRATLLETLSEATRIALEADELLALLQRLVGYVHGRTPADLAAILLLDDRGATLELAAHAATVPVRAALGACWPAATPPFGRALTSGEAQLARGDAVRPLALAEDAEAQLVVPIRLRGELLGVFVFEAREADAFDHESRLVFKTLADQVAGAIRMANANRRLTDASRQLAEANQRLLQLSSSDPLTGIANRRRFDEVLDVEWRRATRAKSPLSVLMIDVDCFKAYNDTYGHQGGDACLTAVARCLRDGLQRAGDFVARYGGEEFVVVLPSTGDRQALRVAEGLRDRVGGLRLEHRSSTAAPHVTVSVGAASVQPSPSHSPLELVQRADEALYEAKREGRNCVRASETEPS